MKFSTFLCFVATIFILGCTKDKKDTGTILCDETRTTVSVVDNMRGVVGYNAEINKWVVNIHIDGTIDGTKTCIICSEVPANLQQNGLVVKISGELKESKGVPMPVLGGQEIYYINPTKLEK